MKFRRDGALVVLVGSLVAIIYGVYRTEPQGVPPPSGSRLGARSDSSIVVDQGSLTTAEQLVRLSTTLDERSFAKDALRLADQEMDLAFAHAVRVAAAQPRATSPQAKALDAQVEQAKRALVADQAQVKELTSRLATARTIDAQALTDRLNLVQAQAALDQDEVDDVTLDLRRVGGDPEGRMQAMTRDHQAASQSSDSVRINVAPAAVTHGLINDLRAWQALHAKARLLAQATFESDSLARAFNTFLETADARATPGTQLSTATPRGDSTAAMLAATQRRALYEKTRATLRQRGDIQRRLASVYTGWLAVVGAQERGVINGAFKSVAAILVVILVAMLIAGWIQHMLGATSTIDRRRIQTLSMVTRISLQIVAVSVILLVLFGPPQNLGTFLGLAGAGLTVALKDFIIGFIGWFVLMRKTGIRIGDLVEINGVTGEVVELGMFHTVLLETGGWSDAGHPTGRRATFMNGFAIEGHYFNFSTAGRWLWDEVRFVVPAGRDPAPIIEAIRKDIEETRAASTNQAEPEWRVTRRAPQLDPRTFAPQINLRPIAGGVEIVARYITDVAERGELKAKLYSTAVEMLAAAAPPSVAEPEEHTVAGSGEPQPLALR